MSSISRYFDFAQHRFIEEKHFDRLSEPFKLKVNRNKSAVALVENRKFLGYQITAKGDHFDRLSALRAVKEVVGYRE